MKEGSQFMEAECPTEIKALLPLSSFVPRQSHPLLSYFPSLLPSLPLCSCSPSHASWSFTLDRLNSALVKNFDLLLEAE